MYGGEKVVAGNILVRQVGTKIHPGNGVGMGKDFTIFATENGQVRYERVGRERKKVSVYPEANAQQSVSAASRRADRRRRTDPVPAVLPYEVRRPSQSPPQSRRWGQGLRRLPA